MKLEKVVFMISIILPYRILAVDPATGISGWSILDVTSISPLRVTVVASGTINGEKIIRENKDLLKNFGRQYCILDVLFDRYVDLIQMYKPTAIVSESAYGYTHMSALISLTLAIHTLRRASHAALGVDIVTVVPTISKKSATGHGGADKDAMRKAYDDAAYITKEDRVLTEHEIDSIWHGIAHIRRDVIGDVEQISAKDKKKKKK